MDIRQIPRAADGVVYSIRRGKKMVSAMALSVVSCTIPTGQSLSSAADASGCERICRIIMPSEWSGGASLSFQLSTDGINYHSLFRVDPNTFFPHEVEAPRPPVGGCITLPPDLGEAVSFVKIRSGTSALPVVQSADREFKFVLSM
jgi:hypothetical protein